MPFASETHILVLVELTRHTRQNFYKETLANTKTHTKKTTFKTFMI